MQGAYETYGGDNKYVQNFGGETPELKKWLGRLKHTLHGRIIQKSILKKRTGMTWTGFIWLRIS